MIPYINRTSDVILSDHIEAARVNVKEVIDEFRGQVDDYKSVFEAIVLMAPGRYRVTFKSHRKMEVAEHTGLTVRGLPVDFRPVSRYTWVNVTRLSYGVPDTEIAKVLEPYGSIRKMSSEVYSNIYTGVRHVLMDISQAIPFRLRIAGHWCFVHYKGQKRVCFACGQEGHNRRNCPDLQSVSKLIGTHTVLDNNAICKYCCPYILSPPLPPPRSMLSYKSKHFDSSNLMANRTQH